jgi:hypothetical protein
MSALLITAGLLLAIMWAVSTVPMILAFHRAASEGGFDVFEPKNAFAFFRLQILPADVRPLAKRIRSRSIMLLWSAAVLIGIGVFMVSKEERSNQPSQSNAGSRPSSDDSPAYETQSVRAPRG